MLSAEIVPSTFCNALVLWFFKERMAKIEQEEKEEHERKKREAEKKKHEIEVAEAMAKKRREEDVDDSKMVSYDGP